MTIQEVPVCSGGLLFWMCAFILLFCCDLTVVPSRGWYSATSSLEMFLEE